MPIQLIIYGIAALSRFATGYYSGWECEHNEIRLPDGYLCECMDFTINNRGVIQYA